jgi:hypothetical protein
MVTNRKHTKRLFLGCNNQAGVPERIERQAGIHILSHTPGAQNSYNTGGFSEIRQR